MAGLQNIAFDAPAVQQENEVLCSNGRVSRKHNRATAINQLPNNRTIVSI